MTVQARAKKGGEFGANGEWYEGGKFLNTVKENAKQSGTGGYARKPRKVQIEPGVWVEQPYENAKPLLAHVGAGADYICRKTQNYGLKPYLPAFERTGTCYGLTLAEMQAICDRYNAGERWE